MGIANECGDNLCPISPHAATTWCLASTGQPVLLVTSLPCPPGDGAGGATVTLIDPATGAVIPAEPVVHCGDRDWEANTLCDYDPVTGELIATFLQIFQWDETTGTVIVTLVRADNPAVPYVPTGTVRACTDDETSTDVEVTRFCYDPAGGDTNAEGWHAWIFVNGTHAADLYYDQQGAVLVAPTIVDCPEPATEATLAAVLAAVDTLEGSVDGLEACCDAGNAILTLINGNVADVEAALAVLIGHVDGLEACCAATNALLTTIDVDTGNIATSTATSATAVHNEDAAHASGHPGIPAWAVRNDDAATTFTDTDGDYSPIAVDEMGRVFTRSDLDAGTVDFDGDDLSGVDSIVIPDGVISFGVTVANAGAGITISGGIIVGTKPLYNGQSIAYSAPDGSVINGPITITGTSAASSANAFWTLPA